MLSGASLATLFPLFCLLAATAVNGHGYVGFIVADNKNYSGPVPFDQDPDSRLNSPIRQIQSEGPVLDVNSTLIACGFNNSVLASEVAEISAGSTLKVQVIQFHFPLGRI